MPGPFKLTLQANIGIQGFSETYYCNASDFDNAFTKALALAIIRQKMMADPSLVKYIKVADDTQRRVSTLTAVGEGTLVPLPLGSFTEDSDIANTCAKITYYSTAERVQRSGDLAGVTDGLYDLSNPGNLNRIRWNSIFQTQFVPFVTAGDFLIKSRRVVTIPTTTYEVTAWENIEGTLLSAIAFKDAVPSLVQGDSLVILANGSISPAPGIVKVMAVGSDLKSASIRYSLAENYEFAPGPRVFRYVPKYAVINKVNFNKVGSHKRGRPFGGSRGRATHRAR